MFLLRQGEVTSDDHGDVQHLLNIYFCTANIVFFYYVGNAGAGLASFLFVGILFPVYGFFV